MKQKKKPKEQFRTKEIDMDKNDKNTMTIQVVLKKTEGDTSAM